LILATGPKNITAIAAFLPVFDRDDCAGGTWTEATESKHGAVSLASFIPDNDASALIKACYENGWILSGFDWESFAQTSEARDLHDAAALEKATPEQLAKLLTIVVRQDRFVEGAFAEAVKSGLVLGILRRAAAIAGKATRKSGVSVYRSQVREVINRNTFISLALAEGFNAFLPVYDGGVDFILYREKDGMIYKVQLKGRWTIDRKYLRRDLWIAFPIEGDWYLVPHDKMVESAEADGKAKSESWLKAGLYSTGKPSKAIIAACAPYRFKAVQAVVAEAAYESEQASDT
jgi:hypothetical protein